jgi:hypothetical protein
MSCDLRVFKFAENSGSLGSKPKEIGSRGNESGAVGEYYIDNNKVTHGFLWAPVRERKRCWLDIRSWVWELQERHGRSFREGKHRPHVVPASALVVSDKPSHLVSAGQADFVTSVGGNGIHLSLRPRGAMEV